MGIYLKIVNDFSIYNGVYFFSKQLKKEKKPTSKNQIFDWVSGQGPFICAIREMKTSETSKEVFGIQTANLFQLRAKWISISPNTETYIHIHWQ